MANKKRQLPQLEEKERTYLLIDKSPISFQLRSRHTKFRPLTWYDGNVQKALRYCSNQESFFTTSQDENALLEAIVFEEGKLIVPPHKNLLQQFLAIHPDNGIIFEEFDPEQAAQTEYEDLLESVDAQAEARDMDITDLEAIARVVYRGRVDNMTSSEIKRDMMMYAKNNPSKFLELANDTDIKLRNLAVRAVDNGILSLRDDGRTVIWTDTNEVLISIPFGENVYSAISAYFKTDEGMDDMQSIMVKLT